MLNTNYKGFELIDITDIPEYASKGIYLRHIKTGLEVFHLLNNDEENLFAFAFRTLPDSSNGAPHILEHSVLCGSEKYPLKDPFVNLVNQSVKTYLNAFTSPDKTIYPASSISSVDYFNLMSVYADAVFFPNLSPEIFLQEAHRLELNEKGECSIQGVVYNEMKGNYSSFDSVNSDEITRTLFPNTIYALDSGGDPSVIPNITHEQLKNFHKEYYRPDNCLVFLYGNIPTETQLDFLQDSILDRLEERNIVQRKNINEVIQSYLTRQTVKPFTQPVTYYTTAPSQGENTKDPTVTLTWNCGSTDNMERYLECVLLSEILCGHDGSPIVKALIDSGLGQDLTPDTGVDGSCKNTMFSIGMRGVKKSNVGKLKNLIFNEIEKLYENGISENDIESAIMAVDFSNREIKRSGGPYSLVIMRRAVKGWSLLKHPKTLVMIRENFERIKGKIKADKSYLQNQIKELFLDNMHFSLVVVTPDENYTKKNDDKEKALIESLRKTTTDDKIKKDNDNLKLFQEKKENLDCLPHLNPRDLSVRADKITNKISKLKDIPFFVNNENTNGIVYIDIGFPCDTVAPENYSMIPLFSYTATNMGWKGKSWSESATEINKICGSFLTTTTTSTCINTPNSKEMQNLAKENNYYDRDWVFFRIKMLAEKTEETLKLLSDCINGLEYKDVKRFKNLLDELKNDTEASLLPSGHVYAVDRVSRHVNRSKAVNEIWEGFTQVFALRKFAKNPRKTMKQMNAIKDTILSSGCIIHLTTEKANEELTTNYIEKFIDKTNLRKPVAKPAILDKNFYEQTNLSKAPECTTEAFTLPSQVGFAARIFKASEFATNNEIAELVFAHWFSSSILWEQIRTIGGAYGSYALSSDDASFTLYTYRDPVPYKSLDAFTFCLKKACETNFDETTTQKAVTGAYSSMIQPKSPSSRGFTGLLRAIYGVSEDDREQRLKWLLALDGKALHDVAIRLFDNNSINENVIICSKVDTITGKINKIKV